MPSMNQTFVMHIKSEFKHFSVKLYSFSICQVSRWVQWTMLK